MVRPKTLTKKELSLKVFELNKGSLKNRRETLKVLKSMLEVISEALAEGRKVSLRELGTFEARFQPERLARNVVAGTIVKTTDKYTLNLKPSTQIKQKLTKSLLP